MWSAQEQAEIARERALDLVLQILRSPAFLAQGTDQQQQTLDEIIATGEVSGRDVHNLILQEQHRQQLAQKAVTTQKQVYRPVKNYDYLTNLPYEVFVTLVDSGQIKGRDLVGLCDSSANLRAMCLKDRQYVNNDGSVYKTDTQYVYRKLLADEGVEIQPNSSPVETYKLLSRSYRYLSGSLDPNSNPPIVFGSPNTPLYAKQVCTGYSHSLILDVYGRVFVNIWGGNRGGIAIGGTNGGVLPITELKDIVQVSAGVNNSAVLDKNGNVWLNNYMMGKFSKFDPAASPGNRINSSQFKQVEMGNELYLLDINSELYKKDVGLTVYDNGHIISLASSIKTFKIDYLSQSEVPNNPNATFLNYFELAAITNANEIFAIKRNHQNLRFKIPGVIPKKVIPSTSRILILSEDGNLYVYDEALSQPSGEYIIRRIIENVAQIDARNIVDISKVYNDSAIVVDADGNVFTVNLNHPSTVIYNIRGDPYLSLKQIPNISDVVAVSAFFRHVDLLQRFF